MEYSSILLSCTVPGEKIKLTIQIKYALKLKRFGHWTVSLSSQFDLASSFYTKLRQKAVSYWSSALEASWTQTRLTSNHKMSSTWFPRRCTNKMPISSSFPRIRNASRAPRIPLCWEGTDRAWTCSKVANVTTEIDSLGPATMVLRTASN